MIVLMGINSSKLLHSKIVSNLLRASFPKFYNIVLTGRLMNRLSKDVYYIDSIMPSNLITAVNKACVTLGYLAMVVMTG